MERSVTLPIERQLNGLPYLTNLRSVSMFGLSVVTLTFEDAATDYFARQQTLERLQTVSLPASVTPQLAPLANAIGEIYRYTLAGPRSLTDLKALQDWTVEPAYRTVPGVADVVSFGGQVKQQINLRLIARPRHQIKRLHPRSRCNLGIVIRIVPGEDDMPAGRARDGEGALPSALLAGIGARLRLAGRRGGERQRGWGISGARVREAGGARRRPVHVGGRHRRGAGRDAGRRADPRPGPGPCDPGRRPPRGDRREGHRRRRGRGHHPRAQRAERPRRAQTGAR